MAQENKNFSKDLKDSSNIAVIANTPNGLDALCASIGIRELIYSFLKDKDDFSVEVYYLDNLPHGSEVFEKDIKIYNKIGEKTLKINFPTEKTEKIQYNFDEKSKKFEIQLVGFKGSLEDNKSQVDFKVDTETFDLVVGVGFKSDSSLFEAVPYVKDVPAFIFNRKNMQGDTLCNGVIDLYFKEKVVPSKLASLAFFTALSYQK